MEVFNKMSERFPCRKKVLKTLMSLIGYCEEMLPAAIHIYGHTGTGKTTLLTNFLNETARRNKNKLNVAFVNCVENYTARIIFENILEYISNKRTADIKIENLKDFVKQLGYLQSQTKAQYIIVLDNAERLRDMDVNVLPSLLRLQQLSGLNICVILISQLPLEKFYCKTSIDDPITLYFTQYTKSETLEILSSDMKNAQKLMVAVLFSKKPENLSTKTEIVNTITREFFNNYLNLFLGVFYKACRDLSELKITARKCFTFYMEPILDGTVNMSDVSRLWRCIAGQLRIALTQVYIRSSQLEVIR